MKITSTRSRLMASTIILGAAMALATAGQASAQAVPTAPPGDTAPGAQPAVQGPPEATVGNTRRSDANTGAATTVQEVTVTGSRIAQPNLRSASPVISVNSQEFKLQGTTQVETLLNNLPSVVADQNQNVDNGASGTATVSLRGLGPTRTLVLIDGKRLMPGDPQTLGADLNNIPAALVDRVEVLTGGASAVYGSDAVAGVVNFIMKRDFQGLRIDAQTGFAQHDNSNGAAQGLLNDFNAAHPNGKIPIPGSVTDGNQTDVTVVLGANAPDGRGNVTAYASYRNLKPIGQGERDFGACGLSTVDPYTAHRCQGSSNSAYGRFFDIGSADNPDGSKTFVPYKGSLAFNFAPFNYFQREDDRYTAGFFAHYKVADHLDVYSDFMFADDSTVGEAAPTALFSNLGGVWNINCDNALASASQLAALCGPNAGVAGQFASNQTIGYRFPGQYPRITTQRHTDYRFVLGARGDFADGWKYDASIQYGEVVNQSTLAQDASIRKINNALNVVSNNGTPTCAVTLSGADPSCVPLDIFQALGKGLSRQALNYVFATGLQTGSTTEQVASVNVTGDLTKYGIKSPFATDGVGVAFGTEYRREALNLTIDQEYATGDLTGAGGVTPPASGNFDVYELYGEVRAPLLQDRPFAKSLTFSGGYRYSNYSSAGNTSTYKGQLEWQPIDDIRFRGGYNRAVRAPNVVELFKPQVVNLGSFGDPCSGGAPQSSLAACLKTAATDPNFANHYGNIPDCGAAQCNILVGGNANLKPEVADTFTVGAVVTPVSDQLHFLHGFTGSADFYYINILKAITGGVPGATALGSCLSNGQFCDLIHRDPGNGSLIGLTTANGFVYNINANSGQVKTSGIDFTFNYKLDFADYGFQNLGSLVFNYIGNYTLEYVFAPVKGQGAYDCTGYFGLTCGEPAPHYRHELRATYITPLPGFSVSAQWRYIGESKLDLNSSDPFLAANGVGFFDKIDAKIPSYSYLDLAATLRVKDHYTFRAGVNNVMDNDPPVFDANNLGVAGTTGFGNGNTFPGVYDTLGRVFFVGLTADF